LPLRVHIPALLLKWCLTTATGCLVDRQLLGSAAQGWPTHLTFLLTMVGASSAAVAWSEARIRREFAAAVDAGAAGAAVIPASMPASPVAKVGSVEGREVGKVGSVEGREVGKGELPACCRRDQPVVSGPRVLSGLYCILMCAPEW
jgi:hypothetical protein